MRDEDRDALLTFFDFPAQHWKHIRTTNVIKSPLATMRRRQRATKGVGNGTKALTMVFKLLAMGAATLAHARWFTPAPTGTGRREVR